MAFGPHLVLHDLHLLGLHPPLLHPGPRPLPRHPLGLPPLGLPPLGLHPLGLHPLGLHPLGLHPLGLHPPGLRPASRWLKLRLLAPRPGLLLSTLRTDRTLVLEILPSSSAALRSRRPGTSISQPRVKHAIQAINLHGCEGNTPQAQRPGFASGLFRRIVPERSRCLND